MLLNKDGIEVHHGVRAEKLKDSERSVLREVHAPSSPGHAKMFRVETRARITDKRGAQHG